jgi:hypothetical protein
MATSEFFSIPPLPPPLQKYGEIGAFIDLLFIEIKKFENKLCTPSHWIFSRDSIRSSLLFLLAIDRMRILKRIQKKCDSGDFQSPEERKIKSKNRQFHIYIYIYIYEWLSMCKPNITYTRTIKDLYFIARFVIKDFWFIARYG